MRTANICIFIKSFLRQQRLPFILSRDDNESNTVTMLMTKYWSRAAWHNSVGKHFSRQSFPLFFYLSDYEKDFSIDYKVQMHIFSSYFHLASPSSVRHWINNFFSLSSNNSLAFTIDLAWVCWLRYPIWQRNEDGRIQIDLIPVKALSRWESWVESSLVASSSLRLRFLFLKSLNSQMETKQNPQNFERNIRNVDPKLKTLFSAPLEGLLVIIHDGTWMECWEFWQRTVGVRDVLNRSQVGDFLNLNSS